jgi:hypothetical protein
MTSDYDALVAVFNAFGKIPKPEHFFPNDGDPESADHNALLCARDRDTLLLSDVDNPGWDPLCSCSSAGFAYYFPTLARFALEPSGDSPSWYAEQLMYLISREGKSNRFLLFCDANQRRAVVKFVEYLVTTRGSQIYADGEANDFAACLSLWQGECISPLG